ncbi:MAG: TlpA disulfide reductase family protein [Mucilaginibacter sp.]|jgi:thiol-disulfide isomerase/thioredoxin|uniref:thioredoxin-like domain-containing protein n=1 Tax=Mucilaginibacter sp. TaxID=1882438 RepID=UPI003569A9F4
MTKKTFLIILLFTVLGCDDKNLESKVIINGNIDNHKSGKIYLVDMAKKDIIKDSTTVVNGHFNFTRKPTSSFLPFEAMLCMWDDYKGMKYLRPIGFVNPYKKKYFESIFYVDRGTTFIANKHNVNNLQVYEIKGSKQNEPYYKHLEFGNLDKNQSITERKRIIADDLNLIAKYPYSFYFLNMLYMNRELYTSDELNLLLGGFEEEAKVFLPYNKLKAWLRYKQKGKTSLTDIILKNEKGVNKPVFDSTAKINMLVFWASWCGPCRKEIPNLKEIYLKYHNKGLSITNISLDNNEKKWQNALAVEKMPWKQLITNDSAKNTFDLEYNTTAIPVVVLINKKGEVITRFSGLLSKEKFYKSLSFLDEN